jgi:hypothetical protein
MKHLTRQFRKRIISFVYKSIRSSLVFLRLELCANKLYLIWFDGVVPFAVKFCLFEVNFCEFFVAYFNSFFVNIFIFKAVPVLTNRLSKMLIHTTCRNCEEKSKASCAPRPITRKQSNEFISRKATAKCVRLGCGED